MLGRGDALSIRAHEGGPTCQHQVFAGWQFPSRSFDRLHSGPLDLNLTVQKDVTD
jgi:hypothetical protein